MALRTFKHSDLEVELLEQSKLKPKPDTSKLVFGNHFTDYMFQVSWDISNGWSKPQIRPVQPLSIHPGAKTLHYGIEMFEATKAFRGVDGKLRFFRPEKHVERFLAGAARLRFPQFEPNEFLKCLTSLVNIEQDWMPAELQKTSSIYIRPVFIATEPSLWVTAAQNVLLYILLCPLAPHDLPGWDRPISLLADPEHIRAWPGGSGDMKFGGNYGRTVHAQEAAEAAGFNHVLWLFGEDHQWTESGIMNVFILLLNEQGEKELLTPPLNGLILPGVNRQSVLELSRQWNEFKVSERSFTMNEFIKASNENRVLEVFGTATLKTVTPIGSVHFKGVTYEIPTVEQKEPLFRKFFQTLTDICYGRVAHPWGVEL